MLPIFNSLLTFITVISLCLNSADAVAEENKLIPLVDGGNRLLEFKRAMAELTFEEREYSEAMANVCRWAMMSEKIGSAGYDQRQKNCVEIAEMLLQKGADINYVHGDKNALLTSAFGRQEIFMQFLLARKANLNVTSKDGDTPLWKAASSGNIENVVRLIKAGAKVNQTNKQGYSPLHAAASSGHVKVVEFLIKNKANLNQKTKTGLTPLNSAQLENCIQVVDTLKKAGAKENPLPAEYVAMQKKNKAYEESPQFAQAKKNAADKKHKEHLNLYARELQFNESRMAAIVNEAGSINSALEKLGAASEQRQFYGKTITGSYCVKNHSDCRTTYQGGGETASSYYRRKGAEDQIHTYKSRLIDLQLEFNRLHRRTEQIHAGQHPN